MKLRLFVIFVVFLAPWAMAQNGPTLEASVSKTTVTEGEIFTYQLVSNSDCSITPPDFGEFKIVSGPAQGVFESSSLVNGVMKSSKQYTLSYSLQAPDKGTYTIDKATMKCKLKKVDSRQTITIKVIEASNAAANQEAKSDHFLKITSNKSSVYVGEPFVLTFKFYTPKKPNNIADIRPGSTAGLWRQDLNPNPLNYVMTQEIVKGEYYFVVEVLREVCIPTRAGKINVEPYYAALAYETDFFSNPTILDGKSNGLTIDVKKIPFNLPDNFNGLVGRFDLVHKIDKTSLKEGQAMELSISISGTGNLNAFDMPKLNLPEGFTQSDPEITDNTVATEDGLKGSLDYKFIITAGKAGDYEVQPFAFSYFDLGSRSVRQLSTEKFTIHVAEGNYDTPYNPRDPVIAVETDIHFIETEPGTYFRIDQFVFGTPAYLVLLAGPLLLVMAVAYTRRRKSSLSEEERAENKQKSARKAAIKALDRASQALKQGDHKEALKTLQNAIFTFFMTKLNLSLSGLSQKTIITELEAKKVDTALILEFSHTWKQIEMAQYAPVTPENLQDNITGAKKLINNLNDFI